MNPSLINEDCGSLKHNEDERNEKNKPKLRNNSLRKLVYNLNCMNNRLSTSIENGTRDTNYNKSLSSEDSYNKSTSSEIYYEICDHYSVSTEGDYEEIRCNSLYDAVGNIKVPNDNENGLDISKNDVNTKESGSLENLTYDAFEKPEAHSQPKAKDVGKPPLPFKPPHLTKVSSKCAKNEEKVDIAMSYNRLEELSRKSEITSKDVQETLRIVKELENLFHDKVNVILSKFKED